MSDFTRWVLCFSVGAALGALFFGGLWWTLRQLPDAKSPALLTLVSALVRMAVALSGLYICARISLAALLVCLTGFLLARALLISALRSPIDDSAGRARRQEPSHAP